MILVEEKGREPEDPMIKKVIELWETYNNFDIVSEKTGLSIEEIKKIIRFPTLPAGVKALVNGGKEIPIDKIDAECDDRGKGIEELASNIKALGLLQPIVVYQKSDSKEYVLLAGQRRYSAFVELNKKYPGEGWDKIPAIVINEHERDAAKMADSMARAGILDQSKTNWDLVNTVYDIWKKYNDYTIIQEKFGLTKYMIDKLVRLAMLPNRLKEAIDQGEIHSNLKTAENAAIRAVDALNWSKDGDVSEDDVLELAKKFAKGEN